MTRSPLLLAPIARARRLFPAGDTMTIIKQGIKTQDVKREVRDIRAAAQKIAASKDSARRFLLATGMYSTNGQIKPQYR
jgi:hypothetical protein